jgi:hypothetical protein
MQTREHTTAQQATMQQFENTNPHVKAMFISRSQIEA